MLPLLLPLPPYRHLQPPNPTSAVSSVAHNSSGNPNVDPSAKSASGNGDADGDNGDEDDGEDDQGSEDDGVGSKDPTDDNDNSTSMAAPATST
ncbi:hypothetical protein FRC04_003832 [Tulasnella sp. 424]|nr:hypothetical protein FRC04_003832 [Tulasnella sp. 424]